MVVIHGYLKRLFTGDAADRPAAGSAASPTDAILYGAVDTGELSFWDDDGAAWVDVTAAAGPIAADDVSVDSTTLVGVGTDVQAVLEELDDSIVASAVPIGAILMWSGTVATIPGGYALCDGTANSPGPDLRDKFVVGAKQDDAGAAKTNLTGSLTVSGAGAVSAHSLTTSVAVSAHSLSTPVAVDAHSLTTSVAVDAHTLTTSVALSAHALTTDVALSAHSLTTNVALSAHNRTTDVAVSTHTLSTNVAIADHTLTTSQGRTSNASTRAFVTTTTATHTITQPVVAAHSITQPVFGDHSITQPVVGAHVITQPVVGAHSITQPVVGNHAITQPVVANHAITQPVVAAHAVTQPVVGDHSTVWPSYFALAFIQRMS